MPLIMSSCTMNEEGDIELTWFFWVILAAFSIAIFASIRNTSSKAKQRGISFEEMIEIEKKENEKKEMSSGLDIEYLGGYPKWSTPGKVKFRIDGSNIVLSRGSDITTISRDHIVAISNEKSGHRNVGKTAAGAIVGGVLTGGIGLIVGGALGARKKDTSEVFITYKYNNVELTLNLKPGKNTDKVYAWINSVFS